MIDDFFDAFRNFSRSKTRTVLSLLGVIIGVASVIVITSIVSSATKQIQSTFGSSALDMCSIRSGFMRKNRDAISLVFDESFRSELFDKVKNIKKIWFENTSSVTLSYAETSVTGNITAVEAGYLEACSISLDEGEFFSVTDDVEGVQKIILGSEVALALFPDGGALGKGVLAVVDKTPFSFRVLGVLKKQSAGMEDATTGMYVPRGFYARKIKPNPTASVVMIQAVSAEACTQVSSDAESFCTEKSGTQGSVSVFSMQTILEQMNQMTQTLALMLSGIAAISLLVGGIGIMNIMIVTVTERRQEIGIRKALGASPTAICRQFLVESACITLVGGAIGILLGIAVSLVVEYISPSLPYALNVSACGISFVFSVLVGVFFGINPARRASKLDPVDALS